MQHGPGSGTSQSSAGGGCRHERCRLPAIWAVNDNAGGDARALRVDGKSQFSDNIDIEGNLTVDGPTTLDGGLLVSGGLRLRVDGDDYLIDIEDVEAPLKIATNAQAGHVHIGKPDMHPAWADADVIIESPRLRVGQNDAVGGHIDANGDGAVAGRPLLIGNTQFRTSEVKIGRLGVNVTVVADLNVGDDLNVIDDLSVGGDCGIIGNLLVGAPLAAAAINAAGNPVAMPLNIGAAATTAGVNIGRNGQQVSIADDLLIGGDCDLAGALQVGALAAAGTIDAGGNPNAQDLQIGTVATTDNVVIGNGDGVVDMFQIARMNSFGLVLDGAATVAAGTGLIFNDAGHGFGDALDVYTGGALRGWFDANGWTAV